MLGQDKIPVERLPLDGFIANQVAYRRKKDRKPDDQYMMQPEKSHREEMEDQAA